MKKHCPLIFKSLYVEPLDQTHAKIGACCTQHSLHTVKKEDISIHHTALEEDRKYYLETGHLPDRCSACAKFHENGLEPKWDEYYIVDFIKTIDSLEKNDTVVELLAFEYNTYSVCNLACVGCYDYLSSQWFKEINQLFGINRSFKKTKKFSKDLPIDFANVKNLYFNGGEPLLSKDMENTIQKCIDQNNYPSLGFHTNGTQPITDEMVSLWEKLPSVFVYVSTNDMYEQFEYNRWPAKWNQMEAFYDQLAEIKNTTNVNLEYAAATDIGILNFLTVHRLNDFLYERGIHHRIIPTRGPGSLEHFPNEAIPDEFYSLLESNQDEEFKQRMYGVLQQTNQTKNINWDWVNRLTRLDDMRELNWRETFPELWQAVKGYPESEPNIPEITKNAPLGIKSPLIIAKG